MAALFTRSERNIVTNSSVTSPRIAFPCVTLSSKKCAIVSAAPVDATMTYVDSLTNSMNRRAYNIKIEELLSLYSRYNTVFSMIMLDIDDFKKINDDYGHRIGDNVLINLVQLIKSKIRQNDILYRVGGEEFIISCEQTSIDEVVVISEKIRKSVEKDLKTLEDKNITISIGVSEVMQNDTENEIFTRVDKLLYQSKANGKNQVRY